MSFYCYIQQYACQVSCSHFHRMHLVPSQHNAKNIAKAIKVQYVRYFHLINVQFDGIV